jgi:hypothetical protein
MVRGPSSSSLEEDDLSICRGGSGYSQSQWVQEPRDNQLPRTALRVAPILLAGMLPIISFIQFLVTWLDR